MVLFAVQAWVFHVAAFATVMVLYAAPGMIFFRTGLRRLWMLWPFVVVICVWHLVTGTPALGAVIALRMVTAVGLANLVTMTTRLSDMVGVVKWLATPLRKLGMNTRAIELGIALVVRFTPVLGDKGAHLVRAWSARSHRRAGWRIILPFTVLAIDDAERVALALRARGGL